MEAKQLTTTLDQVRVCHGCGITRTEAEPYYERMNDLCVPCRLDRDEEREECTGCEEQTFVNDNYKEWMYFSPFDDEERETGDVYCQTCLDSGNDDPDGQKFYCDGCNRSIASDTGHMYNYRILNDCEMVCLKCISEELLAGGIAGLNDEDLLEDVFEARNVFGIFFNVGELESEGWTADELWNDRKTETRNLEELGKRCREHHEAGRAFIIEFERMSIMGDEGYITLRTKRFE